METVVAIENQQYVLKYDLEFLHEKGRNFCEVTLNTYAEFKTLLVMLRLTYKLNLIHKYECLFNRVFYGSAELVTISDRFCIPDCTEETKQSFAEAVRTIFLEMKQE